jgi:hypothetical protein
MIIWYSDLMSNGFVSQKTGTLNLFLPIQRSMCFDHAGPDAKSPLKVSGSPSKSSISIPSQLPNGLIYEIVLSEPGQLKQSY